MLGGRLEFCLLCIDYLWSCYYNCDLIPSISSVPFSRSVMSDSSRPHESQHARPPCPLPFPTVHGVLKARILKWLAILFSSGPHSVRPLHHNPHVLGCPAGMAWFHWVRQGCGPSVIRLTSFLWVWFQCVVSRTRLSDWTELNWTELGHCNRSCRCLEFLSVFAPWTSMLLFGAWAFTRIYYGL